MLIDTAAGDGNMGMPVESSAVGVNGAENSDVQPAFSGSKLFNLQPSGCPVHAIVCKDALLYIVKDYTGFVSIASVSQNYHIQND